MFFLLTVPGFFFQLSIEASSSVITNTSQWHCQLFLICHLLLFSARLRIPTDLGLIYHIVNYKKTFLIWRTILTHKFRMSTCKALKEVTLCHPMSWTSINI
jgi:hypothetical protein